MLASIKGTYRQGRVELQEHPAGARDETPVIITFLGSEVIDLGAEGISAEQAAELRAAFATFEDWNAPEMDIYNDYDAAKANLQAR